MQEQRLAFKRHFLDENLANSSSRHSKAKHQSKSNRKINHDVMISVLSWCNDVMMVEMMRKELTAKVASRIPCQESQHNQLTQMRSQSNCCRWTKFDFFLTFTIPHICHRHHRRCLCKNFLSGVNFSRLSEKMHIFDFFRDIFSVFGAFIPDNCRRRGRRRQCKFFWPV